MGYERWLMLLGGIGLIYASYVGSGMALKFTDPWMILGLMFFLMGVAPFFCKSECCSGSVMSRKKKR